MALRELLAAIPPIMVNNLAITSPVSRALSQCRIYGSNDPTYGTVNWAIPKDNQAFAILKAPSFSNSTPETWRVWEKRQVKIFLAVVHADTPFADENFNDEANAWIDAMQQLVPANRRLLPVSLNISPTTGDVCWELERGTIKERHPIYNIPFYGVEFDTCLRVVEQVQYQG